MPRYSFECQTCSTRFDRTLKMGEHPTHSCPACGEEAPRLFAGASFGFGFSAGSGTSQANTGVHDQDYPTADKIVGRSAEQRWATYVERDKIKKKVREGGGSTALQRVDGEGFTEYAAMLPNERKAREKLVDYAVEVEKSPQAPKPGQ